MEKKYTNAIIFTKRDNLLSYFDSKYSVCSFASHERYKEARSNAAIERDIELIALFRYERDPMTKNIKGFCKIKCPINPLPVKGEFETPDTNAVCCFLLNNGWSIKQKCRLSMFE